MPQPKDYIFAFQDENFNFFTRSADGTVTVGANPYFLEFSPGGWEDIAIQNIKNKVYKAVDRSVSVPLEYVKDGNDIIKHVAYTKGLRQKLQLIICRLDLKFSAGPNGVIAFTSGGPSLPQNITTAGTVTAEPGSTVYLKFTLNNPSLFIESLTGFFGNTVFTHTGFDNVSVAPQPDLIISQVVPPSGVVDFSVLFIASFSSSASASVSVVNANGTTVGSYGYYYKLLTRMEVDWKSFSHSASRIKCQVLEDGLPKYLKANDKVLYELKMNVPEAVFVKMDGINLNNRVDALISDGLSIEPNYDFGNHLIDLSIIREDAEFLPNKQSVKRQKVSNVSSLIKGTQAYFLKTDNASVIEIEYDFPLRVTFFPPPAINPAAIFRVVIRKISATNVNQNAHVLLQLPSALVNGADRRLTGTAVINTDPGDELYLYTFLSVEGSTGDSQMQVTYPIDAVSFFNYKYVYRHPPTYIRALRGQYVFSKLIELVTDGAYTAATSAFLSTYRTVVLTCGQALRGFDDAVMKISLDIFFKFYDTVFSVGLIDRNQQKKVDIAEEEYLYDFNDVIDLQGIELDSLNVTIDAEECINEVTIGFPDITNEVGVLNGVEEPVTNTTWSTNSTTLTGKLEKISPITASPYDIERTRIVTENRDSSDFNTDNRNYTLQIGDILQPASGTIPAHYLLDRSLNPLIISGLREKDTIFNLFFTPARCFERNGSNIRGRFYLGDDETFFFRSAKRNSSLVCAGVVENANINVGSLRPALKIPFVFDFVTAPPTDLIDLLNLNPTQVFRFPFQGATYVGILEKIAQSPSSKGVQKVQLRAAKVNDMTKLLNY